MKFSDTTLGRVERAIANATVARQCLPCVITKAAMIIGTATVGGMSPSSLGTS